MTWPMIRMTVVLFVLFLPLWFISDSTYSFYSPDDAAIKLAYKHSGKKKVGCNELELIDSVAESYKETVVAGRGAQMNMTVIGVCPRERFPVRVELDLNGKSVLARDYLPAGMQRDMASYIFEQLIVKPGTYRIAVRMYDAAPDDPPSFVAEDTVEIGGGEIVIVRFKDVVEGLSIEK